MMKLNEKAIEVTKVYEENPKVSAVILAGSVSRGWQDRHSDIELHILWSEPPTDEDRMHVVHRVNGEIIGFHEYEEEEWAESYITGGIKLEISSFLYSTVDRVINEVVTGYDTSYDKQCLVAAVADGVVLYGDGVDQTLKAKASQYPEELAHKMILENLEFGSRWNNRRALLDREDWLMLYELICSIERKLSGVLFGLNHIYVHHPAFKWMKHSADLMDKKPVQLYERLSDILIGDVESSVAKLEVLIQEVYALVEAEYPELDIEQYKLTAGFVRPEQQL